MLKKNIYKITSLLFVTLILFLSCGLNLDNNSSKTVININFSDNRYAMSDLYEDVTDFTLTIEAKDINIISYDFAVDANSSIEVKAGKNRVFTLVAKDAGGIEIFSGTNTVDLTAGKEISLPIVLEKELGTLTLNFNLDGKTSQTLTFDQMYTVGFEIADLDNDGYDFTGELNSKVDGTGTYKIFFTDLYEDSDDDYTRTLTTDNPPLTLTNGYIQTYDYDVTDSDGELVFKETVENSYTYEEINKDKNIYTHKDTITRFKDGTEIYKSISTHTQTDEIVGDITTYEVSSSDYVEEKGVVTQNTTGEYTVSGYTDDNDLKTIKGTFTDNLTGIVTDINQKYTEVTTTSDNITTVNSTTTDLINDIIISKEVTVTTYNAADGSESVENDSFSIRDQYMEFDIDGDDVIDSRIAFTFTNTSSYDEEIDVDGFTTTSNEVDVTLLKSKTENDSELKAVWPSADTTVYFQWKASKNDTASSSFLKVPIINRFNLQ